MIGSSHKLIKKINYRVKSFTIKRTASNRPPIVIRFSLIFISGRHIRAARALLGWAQNELSKKARVALGTLRRMESFDGPVSARTESLSKVVMALEKAGIEFLNGGSPGVRLKGPVK